MGKYCEITGILESECELCALFGPLATCVVPPTSSFDPRVRTKSPEPSHSYISEDNILASKKYLVSALVEQGRAIERLKAQIARLRENAAKA